MVEFSQGERTVECERSVEFSQGERSVEWLSFHKVREALSG